MTIPQIDFPLFVAWWNRIQRQKTPEIHFKIIDWLNKRHHGNDKNLLLMAFRGCGKSTLIALYATWQLVINPDLRILVISADDHLAERMVRNIRRIIERHPACINILPSHPHEWAANRLTIKRNADLRDPSVMAAGITGNITGMRADLIVCDDVEVPNTCDSSEKREELRAKLHELSFIATPDACTLYIGTPHTFDTIYATTEHSDIPGHVPFLKDYASLSLPVINDTGTLTWPERFSEDRLEVIRKSVGNQKFESQMMLVPTKIGSIYLNPADIIFYEDEIFYRKEIQKTFLGDREITALLSWWDPSLATNNGDKSAIAVVAFDATGHIYIHHVSYVLVNDTRTSVDDQCDYVFNILKKYRVPRLSIETNGIGGLLPDIMRKNAVRNGIGTIITPIQNSQNKNERITLALETALAARMVHAHVDIKSTSFMDELRDFKPGRKNNKDDGLDAVSSAILMRHQHLPPNDDFLKTRPNWRINGS